MLQLLILQLAHGIYFTAVTLAIVALLVVAWYVRYCR